MYGDRAREVPMVERSEMKGTKDGSWSTRGGIGSGEYHFPPVPEDGCLIGWRLQLHQMILVSYLVCVVLLVGDLAKARLYFIQYPTIHSRPSLWPGHL